MANIFRKKDAYIDRVNRSTFDLSFVNNLTMKFGAITPVCLLPASFGDSFQINTPFATASDGRHEVDRHRQKVQR